MDQTRYLSHYINELMVPVYEKLGVFFAFNEKQYHEKRNPKLLYKSFGYGGFCPLENFNDYEKMSGDMFKKAIELDIKENGIDKIIIREAYNHEVFYTGDVQSLIYALSMYNIPEDKILEVYRSEYKKIDWAKY